MPKECTWGKQSHLGPWGMGCRRAGRAHWHHPGAQCRMAPEDAAWAGQAGGCGAHAQPVSRTVPSGRALEQNQHNASAGCLPWPT